MRKLLAVAEGRMERIITGTEVVEKKASELLRGVTNGFGGRRQNE